MIESRAAHQGIPVVSGDGRHLSSPETNLVVPGQGAWIRTLAHGLRRADRVAAKGVVVLAVFKLLADAPADLEVMVGRYGYISGVEQTVDVAPKEKAVLRLMLTAFAIGPDVCGLQGRQCT